MQYVALILGGACGTLSRYLMDQWFIKNVHGRFYFGTLSINMTGCFLIGLFYILSSQKQWFNQFFVMFLMLGFCSAFTTFSTFILEIHKHVQNGQTPNAFLYGLMSLVGGYVFLHAGLAAGRVLSHVG